jgi:hypothetical protein
MAERGITTGFSDDLFGPEEPTKRAHFATFLWRYLGEPRATGSSSFTDVSPSVYYAGAVAWMAGEGITTGTGGGKFSPDSLATRAEAVTFLWRMAGRPSPASPNPFTDVTEDQWYAEAVTWAAETGITTGYSPTIFGPGLNLSRGEAATFLYRYDNLIGAAR